MLPKIFLNLGLFASNKIFSLNSFTSAGFFKIIPSSMSLISSLTPARDDTMTGTPEAIASKTAIPKGS